MTLLMGVVNEDQWLFVSDRRLTYPDGTVKEDEANKTLLLELPSARFAVGITGLAEIAGEASISWVVNALFDAAKPGYALTRTLERLTEQLTAAVLSLGHAKDIKRLTLLGVGYQYGDGTVTPIMWRVSNFQRGADIVLPEAEPRFQLWIWGIREAAGFPAYIVGGVGVTGVAARAAGADLLRLAAARKPVSALVDKAVELFRHASAVDPRIGGQLMIIIVPTVDSALWDYHSQTPSETVYGPAFLRLGPDGGIASDGFKAVSAVGPIVGPRLHKSQVCWCGSGKRYRHCHGDELSRDRTVRFVVGNPTGIVPVKRQTRRRKQRK